MIVKLREFVTLLAAESTKDGTGQSVKNWEPLHRDVPAEVRFLSGNESRRGEQVEAITTHQVIVRWIDGITSQMRIQHGDQVYEIVSCGDPEGKRTWLVCKVNQVG